MRQQHVVIEIEGSTRFWFGSDLWVDSVRFCVDSAVTLPVYRFFRAWPMSAVSIFPNPAVGALDVRAQTLRHFPVL
jgi:hypothetical protein